MTKRRDVVAGSKSAPPRRKSLDLFQKHVQRTDQRLGARGQHHAPPGPNEESVAEVVAQLRKRVTLSPWPTRCGAPVRIENARWSSPTSFTAWSPSVPAR